MKKVVYAAMLLIGMSAFIASCSVKDKNATVVKKEFKQYVQKTFDNPKNLQEIVEIIPSDTISIEKIKTMLRQADEICQLSFQSDNMIDSIYTKALDITNYDRRKMGSADYSTRYKIQSALDDYLESAYKCIGLRMNLINSRAPLIAYCDSLKNEPPLYEYQINYRINQNNEITLQNQFAYIDSLKGFQVIKPNRMTEDDLSPQMQKALRLITKAKTDSELLSDALKKKQTKAEDFLTLLLPYKK